MDGHNWPLVRWVLFVQWLLTLIAAVATALIAGPWKGVFVIAGGLIAMALGLLFAIRLFAVDASKDPEGALSAMRRGAAAKLIASIVIFVLAAKWVPQYVAQLIIGFAAATISYWIALVRAPFGDVPGMEEEGP